MRSKADLVLPKPYWVVVWDWMQDALTMKIDFCSFAQITECSFAARISGTNVPASSPGALLQQSNLVLRLITSPYHTDNMALSQIAAHTGIPLWTLTMRSFNCDSPYVFMVYGKCMCHA